MLPNGDQQDGGHGGGRALQPLAGGQSQIGQHRVEHAEVGLHHLGEDHGHGDHGDHVGHENGGLGKPVQGGVPGAQPDGQQQREQQHRHNHDDGVHRGVLHGHGEGAGMEHLGVVVQSYEFGIFRVDQIGLEKAQVYDLDHGVHREYQNADDGRRDQQIGRQLPQEMVGILPGAGNSILAHFNPLSSSINSG